MAKDSRYVITGDQAGNAGALVWWWHGGDISIEKITEAWKRAKLDKALLPSIPTPQDALGRSVEVLRERKVIIKKVQGTYFVVGIEAHAVKEDSETDIDADFHKECKIRLNAVQQVRIDPPDHPAAKKIKDLYEHNLEHYSPNQISGWLARLTENPLVGGVPEHPQGRIYYIPPAGLPAWEQFVRVIEENSDWTVHQWTAYKTDDKILKSLLSSFMRNTEQAVTEIRETLEDQSKGELAIQNQEARCQSLMDKLEMYRDILGESLDPISNQLYEVQASLGEAKILKKLAADKKLAKA